MSDTKHAGRHLAKDRGAFDAEPKTPEPPRAPITAPLGETAVMHMDPERMIAFIHWIESLA
jgi:hypothetical protein